MNSLTASIGSRPQLRSHQAWHYRLCVSHPNQSPTSHKKVQRRWVTTFLTVWNECIRLLTDDSQSENSRAGGYGSCKGMSSQLLSPARPALQRNSYGLRPTMRSTTEQGVQEKGAKNSASASHDRSTRARFASVYAGTRLRFARQWSEASASCDRTRTLVNACSIQGVSVDGLHSMLR